MVEVDFAWDDEVSAPLTEDEMVAQLERVLEAEQIERLCMVSVSLVTNEHMQDINRTWRDANKVTDVVSLECERPDDLALALDEPCELGDIILAPAYIKDQAVQFNSTLEAEMRLLLVHGMLHLLGYDHLEDDEAAIMEAKEDALVGIDHTLTRHRAGIDD